MAPESLGPGKNTPVRENGPPGVRYTEQSATLDVLAERLGRSLQGLSTAQAALP